MKPHPLLSNIPPCTPDEYGALVASIKAVGQQVPIVVCDGAILDGRARWRACEELKIKPKTITVKAGAEADQIVALNVNRRHLTPSQRACIAALWLNDKFILCGVNPRKHNLGIDMTKYAATLFGVGRAYVSWARSLQFKRPDAFAKCLSGEANLSDEFKLYSRVQKAKREGVKYIRCDDAHDAVRLINDVTARLGVDCYANRAKGGWSVQFVPHNSPPPKPVARYPLFAAATKWAAMQLEET